MENLMSVVGGFIALAIMLAIGTIILGSTGLDCDADLNHTSTGGPDWQKACQTSQEQGVSGYNLLIIVLVIIAAVAILTVVRML